MIMQGDLRKIQDSINPVLEAMGARIKKLEEQVEELSKPKTTSRASKEG